MFSARLRSNFGLDGCLKCAHLGEQNLGSQRLKAVAAAQSVHYANQIVQRLGVGIGDRVLEVVQDLRHPVLERTGEVVEVFMQLRQYGLKLGVVRRQGIMNRLGVVDFIKFFLEPVCLSQKRIVLDPPVQVETLFLS